MHSPIALGRLGAREDIETLYASVVGALAHGASGALPLDLRAVSFISAEGILALSTVGRLWHRRNSEPVILEHVQRQAHQYLERMNVLALCADYICVDGALPAQHRWVRSTSSPTVCELLVFGRLARQRELAETLDVAGQLGSRTLANARR